MKTRYSLVTNHILHGALVLATPASHLPYPARHQHWGSASRQRRALPRPLPLATPTRPAASRGAHSARATAVGANGRVLAADSFTG